MPTEHSAYLRAYRFNNTIYRAIGSAFSLQHNAYGAIEYSQFLHSLLMPIAKIGR